MSGSASDTEFERRIDSEIGCREISKNRARSTSEEKDVPSFQTTATEPFPATAKREPLLVENWLESRATGIGSPIGRPSASKRCRPIPEGLSARISPSEAATNPPSGRGAIWIPAPYQSPTA